MNKRFLSISSLIIAVFAFAGISQAETISTTADLMNNKKALAYVFSRPLLGIMGSRGVEEDRKFGLQTECKSQYLVKPAGVIVLKPMEFAEGQQSPTQGVWLSRYRLERCGDTKTYNAFFFANLDGGTPMARSFHAGSSNAGPILIEDALKVAIPIAVAKARALIKDCKAALVYDMRVTEPAHDVVEGDKVFKGVWNELWTLSMCGQLVDVPMTFIPDANGGGTTFKTGAGD